MGFNFFISSNNALLDNAVLYKRSTSLSCKSKYKSLDGRNLATVKPGLIKDCREFIPAYGSIIYTVWDKNEKIIYVGIGGLGRSPDIPLNKRNPRSRINQHRSGRRSGDQFCIYVHDYYIVPSLDIKTYQFRRGYLDQLTRDFIQRELFYRFKVFQTEDGNKFVRKIEKRVKEGVFDFPPPLLNGSKK